MISELNERSREIFRQIVDNFLTHGTPVASRALSRMPGQSLSAASIRNVMADLQDSGLLYSPHTSAGRIPTEQGLRLYIDGLLEIGDLAKDERDRIDNQCKAAGLSPDTIMAEATQSLSGLSAQASIVLAPRTDRSFRHVEIVPLSQTTALVVLVLDHGLVENRIIQIPTGLPRSALIEAGNYLTAKLAGKPIDRAIVDIQSEIARNETALSELTATLVENGLASWAGGSQESNDGTLIVSGKSQLLSDVSSLGQLEQARNLLTSLENRRNTLTLLDSIDQSASVQIFIGTENPLFSASGSAMIVAPFQAGALEGRKVLGAIGVVGPTRMNYARIVPMVDYTAKAIGKILGNAN